MKSAWRLTRDMFLSFAEVDLLLEHLRAKCSEASGRAEVSARLDRLIIEGLLFSGLRTTEFCRLKVTDTVMGRGESVFVVEGMKGRDRTVCIPTTVSRVVEQFVAETRPALLPEGVDPDDLTLPLVYGERKNPLERTGLYRRVVRILTAVGLGDRASVQLLRHTYGYLAYARSHGNLLFVQRQLGHAHPMVTAIYAQFVEEPPQLLAEQVYCPATAANRTGGTENEPDRK
jgi:integrase/recombinase XerD